ncbi:MAG: roadblock/LC7 domain-containing protein [Candidatus Helarchaeales archaeon]
MANKDEIEKLLADLMDNIPEIEGLIAAEDGKVIVGQTLTELDHSGVADNSVKILENATKLAQIIEKGDVKEINVRANDGYVIIVGSGNLLFAAITGTDATSSLGLIQRNLRIALEKVL